MNQVSKILLFVILPAAYLYGQPEVDWKPPLFSPAAILIQDESIRTELDVTQKQTPDLDRLCEGLDPLLFVMRDVPADTTDLKSRAMAVQITEKLKELDSLLNSRQQQRLEQLRLQYEGFESLFYPRIQSRLGLSSAQMTQIRQIHKQSLMRQQKLVQKKSPDQNEPSVQQQIQKIVYRQTHQILKVMSNDQRKQWQGMLGDVFDFSQTQPIFFQVPELKDVTAWINTEPISMENLRGRVVVVHFWTFGCSNCIQNYPVYKKWTQQYDPKEVQVLGIHTPEAEYEKDLGTLRKRIKQEELLFAVAVDNDKANWNAWSNRMWPSVYLVDKKGRLRYWWYGEMRWQGATGDQWMTQRIEELRAEK